MCNYSKGIEDRGIAKGMAKGIDLGRLEIIQNAMSALSWTAEQAVVALDVPVEDRERYLKMLNER